MDDFVGCSVSIEVIGGLGWYQGEVTEVCVQRQTITLTKVLHNGRPTAHNTVTLNAGDIKNLNLIAKKKGLEDVNSSSKEEKTKSSVEDVQSRLLTEDLKALALQSNESSDAKKKNVKSRKPRTSVGETLAHGSQLNSNANSKPSASLSVTQSKVSASEGVNSADTRERENDPLREECYFRPHPQDYGSPRRGDFYKTPNKRDKQSRINNRDNATFGTPIDDEFINTEFDFEKNLALFDKQAVYDEIQSSKPDIVRGAEKKADKNYHHRENVIPGGEPACKNQITVPASGAAEVVYATDNGQLVPSVTSELRTSILSTANQHGLTNSRQLEIIGRGATELILSLIGGSHRLQPDNTHQAPVVVVLCGGHIQGAAGVNTARQLECHGVRTRVVVPPLPTTPPVSLLLSHELQLYNLTAGKVSTDINTIKSNLDLIVDARVDQNGQVENIGTPDSQNWLLKTTAWASKCRAPVLALDPPSDLSPLQTMPPLPARILLCIALPLAYTPGRGKVYLLNLPIPLQTYNSVGINYTPPFGSKLVIPLHPCE